MLLLLIACQESPDRILGPSDWKVLLRVPHPDDTFFLSMADDGALFVVTFDGSVWRSRPPAYAAWDEIVVGNGEQSPGRFNALWAPSADQFFAIQGSRVYRWGAASGVREEVVPLSHATSFCYDYFTGVSLESIWGRDSLDVYAVGDHGEIIHYDGASWKLQSTEMTASAPDVCYGSYAHALWTVGGDANSVFAAGGHVFQRIGDGEWSMLPNPEGADSTAMITGVAVLNDGAWFVQANRLYHRVGDKWAVSRLPVTVDWKHGSRQPDGTALFWDYNKYVTRIRNGRATVYFLSGVRGFRGAVATGPTVFAVGYHGDTSVILSAVP